MTRETCAQKCCADGFKGNDVLIGVEYAAQCFCGHGFAVPNPPKSGACHMKCPGNASVYDHILRTCCVSCLQNFDAPLV